MSDAELSLLSLPGPVLGIIAANVVMECPKQWCLAASTCATLWEVQLAYLDTMEPNTLPGLQATFMRPSLALRNGSPSYEGHIDEVPVLLSCGGYWSCMCHISDFVFLSVQGATWMLHKSARAPLIGFRVQHKERPYRRYGEHPSPPKVETPFVASREGVGRLRMLVSSPPFTGS